jgi:hypothetical protein
MSSTNIQVTKNYHLFLRHSGENRPLDLKKHKKLMGSMGRYGFLRSYPIVVVRDESNALVVKDGQHRLVIAEELGLPVYWVEESVDFDVAIVNSTPKPWALQDYAQKHAANGLTDYQEGMDFAGRHGLPIGTAFALLAGTVAFTNCRDDFVNGTFVVKDRQWAETVAAIYGPLVAMNKRIKNARFTEACMAACRVAGFDAKRLLANAARCREKLIAYATREEYLRMLEAVYNYGRRQLVNLKFLAIMGMRERAAAKRKAARDKEVA